MKKNQFSINKVYNLHIISTYRIADAWRLFILMKCIKHGCHFNIDFSSVWLLKSFFSPSLILLEYVCIITLQPELVNLILAQNTMLCLLLLQTPLTVLYLVLVSLTMRLYYQTFFRITKIVTFRSDCAHFFWKFFLINNNYVQPLSEIAFLII